jgi:predicted DNA-binding transcriptional regulator YafY
MGSVSLVRQQLRRLLRILLALRTHAAPNAGELARLCGVSRRTIYRDLDTLGQVGIPLRYETERRGYKLDPDFRLDVPRLDEKEIAALVILVASCDDLDALGQSEDARRALGKLMLGRPRESTWRLADMVDRIGPGPGSDVLVDPDRKDVFDTILAALLRRRQVRVEFPSIDRDMLDRSTRLSPYRLCRHRARWLVVGRSSVHRGVRTFALAQLRRACLTEDGYTIPPRFRCERTAGPGIPGGECRFRLRFTARSAAQASEQLRGPRVRRCWSDDGRLEVEAVADNLGAALEWLLGFWEDVEVLDPAELRDLLVATARRVILNHLPVNLVSREQANPA